MLCLFVTTLNFWEYFKSNVNDINDFINQEIKQITPNDRKRHGDCFRLDCQTVDVNNSSIYFTTRVSEDYACRKLKEEDAE